MYSKNKSQCKVQKVQTEKNIKQEKVGMKRKERKKGKRKERKKEAIKMLH